MRILGVLLIVLCVLGSVGCGPKDEGEVKKEGTVEVIQPKPGDVPPEQRRRTESEEQ